MQVLPVTSREWAIAVIYTVVTATDALFIAGMLTADSDMSFCMLLLAIATTTAIIGSLSSYSSEYDDIQEY